MISSYSLKLVRRNQTAGDNPRAPQLKLLRRSHLFHALCCLVMVLPMATLQAETVRKAAMNLHWVRDYLPPILADAMEHNHSRNWQDPDTGSDLPSSQIDADGWPTTDAQITLWHNMPAPRTGLYTAYYEGEADLEVAWTSDVVLLNNSYNASTNQSVATLEMVAPATQLRLVFRNTTNGVRNVKLMRPIAEGSMTSHDPEEVMDRVMKSQMSQLNIIRYMDTQNTNAAPETSWDTRKIPGSRKNRVGFNPFAGSTAANEYGYEGGYTLSGVPLEYIVEISNATQTDPYICIPAMSDDDFIRKTAQLFKYGSDGVNPYTSPQANPVWEPLDSNLTLYVEYSNEVWNTNSGFRQNHYTRWASVEAVTSNYNHPINSDNLVSTPAEADAQMWTLRARYAAWRAVEMSRIFREVFPTEIMDRVRPLFCFQIRRNDSNTLSDLHWAQQYYVESEGHGLGYFFWGGGPANYRSNRGEPLDTVDDAFTAGTLGYDAHYQEMVYNARLAATFGFEFMSYEGGPSYGDSLGGSGDWHPIAPAAHVDPRMYDKVIETHEIMEKVGGAFGTLYVWHHGWAWSFVHPDTFSDNTYRAQAMYDSKNASRVAPDIGILLPTTIAGKNFVSANPGWKISRSATTGTYSMPANDAVGYMIRSVAGGAHTLTIRYTAKGALSFHVIIDGMYAGTVSESGSTGSKLSPTFNFNLEAQDVSGISIINAGSSEVVLEDLIIDTASGVVAPSITSQPSSLTVTVGDPASFSVSATGSTPLAYQWRKNGSNISGATASVLSINNAQLGDSGDYTVRVSNSAGNVTSSVATLTVNEDIPDNTPPLASVSASPQSGTEPLTVNLDASASSDADQDPLSYEWDFDDGNGYVNGSVTESVTFTSAGTYLVSVRVSDGTATDIASVSITVNPDPGSGGGGDPVVLASWDFVGVAGAATSAPDSVASGLSASVTSFGSGLEAKTYNGGDAFTARRQTMMTLSDAIADGEYISFTLTPDAGSSLSVSELRMRPVSQNNARTFSVLSSVDGFTAGQELGSFTIQSNGNAPEQVISISSISGQTGPVEFRIYVHGYNNQWESLGLGLFDGDDLVVEGVVSSNAPPVASLTSDVQSGNEPLTVNFDASGSSDPDQDPLSYEWNFDDGNGFVSGSATESVVFASAGTYQVQVRVSDGSATDTASVSITVNESGSGGGDPVILASWDFAGTGGAATSPADSVASGLTASAASFGSGLEAKSYNGGDGFTARRQTMMTLGDAIADGEYISITLTPDAGSSFSVTALRLRPVSQNNARTFTVLSSVGGFSVGQELGSFTVQSNGGAAEEVISISSISGETGPVEIRVYIHGYNNQWESAGLGLETGDDLIVEGVIN